MQHESHNALLYPNLDFEYALLHGSGWNPPKIVAAMCTRWRHLLRCLPGLEEASVWDGITPLAPDQTLKAWGVDHRVLQAYSESTRASSPSLDVITRVNDKRYAVSERKRVGIEGLELSREVRSLEELQTAARTISANNSPWLLKHPLGVSGRERMTSGPGEHGLSESVLAWASKHFEKGWSLVLEPRVEISSEYSLHAEISPRGEISHIGWCHLMADPVSGTHRGHRIERDVSPPARVARWWRHVGDILEDIATRGYHGPVSIDAWVGRLEGEEIEQPVSEINARYTFGRMALELARFVPDAHDYAWHHPRHSSANERRARALERSCSPGEYRLPERIDPGGESGTWIEVLAADQGDK